MSDAITEKIKNLLRLAKCDGATPAEAAAALNKALNLVEKYQIDIASLDLDEQTEQLITEEIHVGRGVSFIKHRTFAVMVGYFSVRVTHCWDKITVVGYEQDTAIAGYVYHFLVKAANRSLNEYKDQERAARRKITAKKTRNYLAGWFYGLTRNLRKKDAPDYAVEDSKAALILADRKSKLDAYYEELYPGIPSLKEPKYQESKDDLLRGYIEGKKTSIHQPLADAQQGTLLLT